MVTTLEAPQAPASAAAPKVPAPALSRAIALTAAQLTANLAGRTPEEAAALEWFRAHCAARGLSYEEAGRKLHKTGGQPYSRDSVYQAMSGARGMEVSLAPLCEAIARYRRDVEAPVPAEGFLATKLFRVIRAHIARAKKRKKVAIIVGQNACGKTTCIEQMERENAHVTKIHVPEGGHLSALLPAMARRRGYGPRQTVRDLCERMIGEFGPEDVLVFDEADQCFHARSSVLGNKTLDFMRRLRDLSGATIVLIMDPAGYARLQKVQANDPLRRIFCRRLTLILPTFFREDLDLFARRYKLPAAPDMDVTVNITTAGGVVRHTDNPRRVQDAVCGAHTEGLFQWLDILQDAADDALDQGRTLNWQAVLKAHALHVAMECEAAA